MKMSKEAKIAVWEARQRRLAAKGLQNAHLIAKIKRKINNINK